MSLERRVGGCFGLAAVAVRVAPRAAAARSGVRFAPARDPLAADFAPAAAFTARLRVLVSASDTCTPSAGYA
jgi:hypothetical protein